jgi:hypothetical protein
MLKKMVSAALRISAGSVLALGISALAVTGAAAQTNVRPVPRGYFWLYNYHSGKCAYIVGASARSGAKLAQSTCKNSREFGFQPKTGFSGSDYFFQSSVNIPSPRHHFLCVSVANNRRGSTLIQEPCNYQNVPTKQRFIFHFGVFSHGYTWSVIESVASNQCVNIAGGSKANGAAVQQQFCTSVHNQSNWFIFVKAGTRLPCPCVNNGALPDAVRQGARP